jgi:mannosyltransferase OCH1-like enzyme
MIPYRLIRSVPERTSDEVEALWAKACALHPNWRHDTFRDPIDPELFPLTSAHWSSCSSGAQLAGLVRLEALWHDGGVWLDSDFDCFRPFDSLLHCSAFAGYEDPGVVPDAVIGAVPHHPAIGECVKLALQRLHGTGTSFMDDAGAWSTGPGVTTTVFPGRSDVLLLPPDSFYPIHYSHKAEVDWDTVHINRPWAFGAHRWHASWL